MRFTFLTSLVALATAVFAQSAEGYVESEGPLAKAGVLANIGANGSKSSGAKAGVVVASPSTHDPDYLYTWTRDSSLVFKLIVDQFTSGEDTSLRSLIDNFTSSQARIQQVTNPSGSVTTGGLGEAKFQIDETAFTGAWGRPQRDGPPLRAITVMTYANWLLENGNGTAYVIDTLWPIIKLDLDYTRDNWNMSTFDLWEEVNSSSFFTTAAQHRALREGAALARGIGQTSIVDAYITQADNVLCFLQTYWNPSAGYITANTGGGRSGKDANTVLTSIHTFDSAAGCDAVTFQPCSDKALSNLKVYVDAFRSIYTVNNGISATAAVATGRYPEDSYYGGNPWYLTTAAVAEQLYDAIIVWNKQGELEVTSTSLAFFQQFSPNISVGTYPASSSTFTSLISSIKNFADGFLLVNAQYTPSNGALAEQYTRNDGTPISASDLTWSYAATLTAFAAREGKTYSSWGAAGLEPSSTCGGNAGPSVSVTFNVQATTIFGENIYITGSVEALKNWSPDNALILSAAKYPIWSITVTLPANTNVEYKFIRKYNGQITWESDPNDSFTTPSSGSATREDQWR